MATMHEVAQRAGVSVTTVSHVINQTRFVSDEVVARVKSAIAELNYQPDRRARSLRRGRSEVIGAVLSDIGNTFFSDVVRGVEDRVIEDGFELLLCNTDENPSAEARHLESMLEQRVDGLVVAPTVGGVANLEPLVRQGTPLVVVDRPIDLDVDQVFSDNEQGAYDAARHLIDLGHRRMGVIVEILGIRSFDDRLRGWQRALAESGIEFRDGDVRQAGLEIEGATAAARALLEVADPPTAVFASNNLMTLGVLRYLAQTGLRCPEELSLVGFDDPPWAASFRPGITSVAQHPYEMGYTAAEMLLNRINGVESKPAQVCLPCELQVRQSSAGIKRKPR